MTSDEAARNVEAPSIEARGLTVVYANGHVAIRDMSFSLASGTITGLVGINGSGKSTLFKAIMGFVRPSQGEIRIGGRPASEALRRNVVAYVPQTEDVDWDFPVLVEDVVMMGRYGHMGFLRMPSKADRRKVDEALARVDMSAFRERQIGELSGGQKKRVFLARALAQESGVILLDEPFTGVDVTTENAIVALLRELSGQGHLILVSTHNLGSVPAFCDHVLLINRELIAAGPTTETFTKANLEAAFGGVLRHVTLEGASLHKDDDPRAVTVLTDDESPLVFYGERGEGAEGEPDPTPKARGRATGEGA